MGGLELVEVGLFLVGHNGLELGKYGTSLRAIRAAIENVRPAEWFAPPGNLTADELFATLGGEGSALAHAFGTSYAA